MNKPPDRYGFGTVRPPGRGLYSPDSSLAVFQRRKAARLQDRRDLHQRSERRRSAAILCRSDHQGQSRASRGHDLGIRRHRRRRPERSLRHGADLRPLRHADQRSEDFENRRQMGMDHGARTAFERPKAAPGSTAISSPSRNTPKTRSGRWTSSRCVHKDWKQRSMVRGNAPPRGSVLEDPAMVELIGWPPTAARPSKPVSQPPPTRLGHVGVSIRTGLSQAILGQKTPEQALDDVAVGLATRPARAGSADDPPPPVARHRRHAMPHLARAGSKPEKLVFVGDNGPWHWCLVEEVAPAFEKADRHQNRLHPAADRRAERQAESRTQFRLPRHRHHPVDRHSRLARPHLADHAKLLAGTASKHPDYDWDDFLPAVRDLASWQGKLLGIPYRITTGILTIRNNCSPTPASPRRRRLGRTSWPPRKPRPSAPRTLRPGHLGPPRPGHVGCFTRSCVGNGGRLLDPKTGDRDQQP